MDFSQSLVTSELAAWPVSPPRRPPCAGRGAHRTACLRRSTQGRKFSIVTPELAAVRSLHLGGLPAQGEALTGLPI